MHDPKATIDLDVGLTAPRCGLYDNQEDRTRFRKLTPTSFSPDQFNYVGRRSRSAARRSTMLRWIRTPLVLALVLFASGGIARAQYGWGWGGWGGWGETPEGSAARGLGVLYAGAGEFNERTAISNSINAYTWQRWN